MIGRSQQRCGNCDAFVQTRAGHPAGTCVAKSPTPFPVTIPNAAAQLDPKQPPFTNAVQGLWPPSQATLWCREWQMKVEGST